MLKANMMLAEANPEMILEGKVPRLIDEWQLAPTLWDAARFVVSQRGLPGQLLLYLNRYKRRARESLLMPFD